MEHASSEAFRRWQEDLWAQAPHHYEDSNMVQDARGNRRTLLPCEEDKLMGYPSDYTAVIKKAEGEDHRAHAYRRHTVLGNSWSLHVACFIVKVLISPYVLPEGLQGYSGFEYIDEESFWWGISHCPYLQDLEDRKVPAASSLPPDWQEMHAHMSGGLSEKVQSRKHNPWHLSRNSFSFGPVSSLPKGLPPEVHFKAGCLAGSPSDAPCKVPDDMDFAIKKTIALGARADAWRRERIKALKSWLAHAHDLESLWNSLRSENAIEVAPNVRPHVLDLMAHSIKWPDIPLPAMMAVGALPLGRQEHTGIFRHKLTEASLEEQVFQNSCAGYMESLMSRPPPRCDQAKIICDLSTKEQEAGLLSPWRSASFLDQKYGSGKWRALPRYAIKQGDKYRLIDNGRSGDHNFTYSADETIHTTCTSAGVGVASRFRELIGKPLRGDNSLLVSTQDMWKAYRQIPCHHSHLRYMTVMVWHPARKEWVFGESMGLLFGITGAVLSFNRVPALVVALARRWLAIPVQNFFDDLRIMDLARSNGSANRFFCILVEEILGFKLDSGKEQLPSHRAVFLGTIGLQANRAPGLNDAGSEGGPA
jgi:hypothetical protein